MAFHACEPASPEQCLRSYGVPELPQLGKRQSSKSFQARDWQFADLLSLHIAAWVFCTR